MIAVTTQWGVHLNYLKTQGKIERYYRSMKNVVMLEHFFFLWALEKTIAE
ncbi:MAG: hypothetical protein ACI9JM_002636 [Halioglobus sp.]